MEKTLAEIAQAIDGKVVGDDSMVVHSGATLEAAQSGQISFLANARYAPLIHETRASAVLVSQAMDAPVTQIIVANPYYAFTQVLVLLHGHRQHPAVGISPEAFLHPTAEVGEKTSLHHGVTVCEGVRIGRNCTCYPGVYLGRNVVLGDDCVLYPNVVVYEECQLGHRVILHANTTIGQDGLGFSTEEGRHHKIPHIARAILGDDVEIGAGSGVERGSLQDTVISSGSKIGSQVIIGHGVQLGEHAMIVAQTGIAGSTRLGHHCTLAGQVGIAGHIELGNHVTVAAKSGVSQNIPDGTRVFGYPAFEMEQAVEAYSLIKRLPELRRTLRLLEQRVKAMEQSQARPS